MSNSHVLTLLTGHLGGDHSVYLYSSRIDLAVLMTARTSLDDVLSGCLSNQSLVMFVGNVFAANGSFCVRFSGTKVSFLFDASHRYR